MKKVLKLVGIRQIVRFLEKAGMDFEIHGNIENKIVGFSSINNYQENTITWIKNSHRYQSLKNTEEIKPALIVIDREVEKISNYTNKLVCDNPKYIFALILREFFEEKVNTGIGCNCVIEDDVVIGSGTRIYHNVTIRKGTAIGKNCII